MELEQSPQQRPRVLAVDVAPLDERDRVRQVGEREAVCESRAVCALGGVGGRDELACGPAAQAPTAPQLLDTGHGQESTTFMGASA